MPFAVVMLTWSTRRVHIIAFSKVSFFRCLKTLQNIFVRRSVFVWVCVPLKTDISCVFGDCFRKCPFSPSTLKTMCFQKSPLSKRFRKSPFPSAFWVVVWTMGENLFTRPHWTMRFQTPCVFKSLHFWNRFRKSPFSSAFSVVVLSTTRENALRSLRLQTKRNSVIKLWTEPTFSKGPDVQMVWDCTERRNFTVCPPLNLLHSRNSPKSNLVPQGPLSSLSRDEERGPWERGCSNIRNRTQAANTLVRSVAPKSEAHSDWKALLRK